MRNPELRRAADSYDRAARARYGAVPARSHQGNQLRHAARLMAMTGTVTGDTVLVAAVLAANLVALAVAVAELREAQQLAGKLLPRVPRPSIFMPPPGVYGRQPHGRTPGRLRGRPPPHALPLPASRHRRSQIRRSGQVLRRPPGPHRGPMPPRRAGPGR